MYLDQWVWIRLTKAQQGRPDFDADLGVLSAVNRAVEAGVAFPLSITHYEETGRVLDPRQRRDLGGLMAPTSQLRTFRQREDLIRFQLSAAMSATFDMPPVQPIDSEIFGLGHFWAEGGHNVFARLVDSDGAVLDRADPAWLRRFNQYAEAAVLSGPDDNETTKLTPLGYIPPRVLEAEKNNRLQREQQFAARIASEQLSINELRGLLLARELTHDSLKDIISILSEHGLSLGDIHASSNPNVARGNAIALTELVPTLRIAGEMKLQVLRNPQRKWSWNMIRDIDAISIAVPYCRIVVTDRDAADMVHRTKADQRSATLVISDLRKLEDALHDLEAEAIAHGKDDAGWGFVGPASAFQLTRPEPLPRAGLPPDAKFRLFSQDGTPISFPSPL